MIQFYCDAKRSSKSASGRGGIVLRSYWSQDMSGKQPLALAGRPQLRDMAAPI
jgi:hypothetical protein